MCAYRTAIVWFCCCLLMCSADGPRAWSAEDALQVGVAETVITPPLEFPMSGYYFERLATGTRDPLKAKAVVWKTSETQAAWVVCDLIGIGIDLSTVVRQRASEKTGIPAANIVVSATHSHTAPDYSTALYGHLGPASELTTDTQRTRAAYAGQLVDGIVSAIVQAAELAVPVELTAGTAEQKTPVSFCRRFVMRDGSVQTWVGMKHPEAVRASAPIDPELCLVKITPVGKSQPLGLLSNFALHLDTVGGTQWSGDYPYFVEQAVRASCGPDVVSLFGLGCCGDINHVNPDGLPANKTDVIGAALSETIVGKLNDLKPVERPRLQARSRVVPLPLEEVSPAEIQQSVVVVRTAKGGGKVDFLDHVRSYKRLLLDTLHHAEPLPEATAQMSWGRTRTWQGVGPALPVEVHTITLGSDVALVFLPGEVFVELGLAIKRASPFRTTLVVELSQCKETIYVPNRQAYVGGGYESTNTTLQPGGGELLVEAAIGLLRESAAEVAPRKE